MKHLLFLCFTLALCLFTNLALCDTLNLNDGRIIQGKFIKGDKGGITFEADGKIMGFPLASISSISFGVKKSREDALKSSAPDTKTSSIKEPVDEKKKAFLEQKNIIEDSMRARVEEIRALKINLERQINYWTNMTILDSKAKAVGSRDRTWDRKKDNIDNDIKTMQYKIKEHEGAIKEMKIKRGDLKLKVVEVLGKLPEWWGMEYNPEINE